MQAKPSTPPKPVTELWRPELTRLPKLTWARRAYRRFWHGLIKFVARVGLRLTAEGMDEFPRHGPLLVVLNHIGDADGVAIVACLPVPPDALGKVELYDAPILGRLMDWYGIIWLHRGRPDKRALRAALDGLAEGRIIMIAPEGRHTVTGALEQGTGGAAFIAQKSGVPILPIAVTGTANDTVYGNLKQLRRAAVHVRIGRMFRLDESGVGRKELARQSTKRIMHALAELLPQEYRGEYSEEESEDTYPQPPSVTLSRNPERSEGSRSSGENRDSSSLRSSE